MNNKHYIYSILQYRHSQILGEVLNIGALVYFPVVNQLRFIYPEKLIRLRFAYPNVPEKTIKAFFKSFNDRIAILNKQPEFFSNYDLSISFAGFIEREFLPADASLLQFDSPKLSLLYTDDLNRITDQLYNLYFSLFEHHANIVKKVDESHLLSRFKKLIKELDSDFQHNQHLQFDYTIKPEAGKEFKFDIAWKGSQNDTHLVKPISFDLARHESIQRKTYQYFGQFWDLQDYAGKKQLTFDLLIAKPRNKQLYKFYDKGLELLEQPKHVKIYEESEIKEYSQKTLKGTLFN